MPICEDVSVFYVQANVPDMTKKANSKGSNLNFSFIA